MPVLHMFDDVTVSLLPGGADAYACYIDGWYKNAPAVQARFPGKPIVTIAVRSADDADCLDVETGDASNADVYAWLKRQLARGVYRPVIYTSAGNIDKLMLTMAANHFDRSQYRLWSAHYGYSGGAHTCGPSTCRECETACDWTQFTSTALGESLDESVIDAVPLFTTPAAPPSGAWSFGPPSGLSARPGHTNVAVAWSPPLGAPEAPAAYVVYMYRGGPSACSVKTGVPSYPRSIRGTSASVGSLAERTEYTVHVVAEGDDGAHVRPYTYASATFTTGGS